MGDLNPLRIKDLRPILEYHRQINPGYAERHVPVGPKGVLVSRLRQCLEHAYGESDKETYERLVGYIAMMARRGRSTVHYSDYAWRSGQTCPVPEAGSWVGYDEAVRKLADARSRAAETVGVAAAVPGGLVSAQCLRPTAEAFAAALLAGVSPCSHGPPDLSKTTFGDCGMLSVEASITAPEFWGASPTHMFVQAVRFRLTDEQAALLAPGPADPRKGTMGVYLYMGRLDLVAARSLSEGRPIPVQNPATFWVKVNGRVCHVPDAAAGGGAPIDVLGLVHRTSAHDNAVEVGFMSSLPLAVAVALARRHTPESMAARIREANLATADSVRQKFFSGTSGSDAGSDGGGGDDDDIVPEGALVNLKCPLGLCRIKTPARSTRCKHSQCFDCETFLQFYQSKPVWKCPVCSVPIRSWRELLVDGYFEDILGKTAPGDEQIYIGPNGDWQRKEAADAFSPRKGAPSARPLEVDADDVAAVSDSSNGPDAAPSKRRRTDFVDLTLDSDSDDAGDSRLPPLTQEELDMIAAVEATIAAENSRASAATPVASRAVVLEPQAPATGPAGGRRAAAGSNGSGSNDAAARRRTMGSVPGPAPAPAPAPSPQPTPTRSNSGGGGGGWRRTPYTARRPLVATTINMTTCPSPLGPGSPGGLQPSPWGPRSTPALIVPRVAAAPVQTAQRPPAAVRSSSWAPAASVASPTTHVLHPGPPRQPRPPVVGMSPTYTSLFLNGQLDGARPSTAPGNPHAPR
ncbi:E3 SUMO-protein ligase pli1 [Coemansia javaensis]|uniref:E3 SUMO-protein ligase pli1 n=1 Tax=Coemansia javaensis TaxID=2761396 RepID=A0A9W8LK35_9FUNG|nr:E3 SUMO-protein ligase pli1 [Coemansia javaensis]